jgi:hypothetical protein
MQSLTDLPRTSLNAASVLSLLRDSEALQIQYGADLLDMNQNYISDLTPYLSEGSTIDRDNYATIHGTCTLNIDSNAPINVSNQLVRPWQKLVDYNTGYTAQFYLGVYTLTTPDHDNALLPSTMVAQGFDLIYFLTQPIGDSVQFLAGTNPIDNCISLIGQAFGSVVVSVNSTAFAGTLATDAVYPFDESNNATTYLAVINDQLGAAGYQGIWVDWSGTFQMQPYVAPADRDSEYVFDVTNSAQNIVAESRTSNQDIFDVPNWWRFIMQGLQTAPAEGTTQYTFINNDTTDPTSYPNRGFYVKKVAFVQAVDYPSLVTLGSRTIIADQGPTETIAMTTSPFPLAWHFDQAFLVDPNMVQVQPQASQYRRIQCQNWSMPLDGTSDMTWNWESVN